MHTNTFRRPPLTGGPLRGAAVEPAERERWVSPTSALLIVLAVLGIVVTLLFGMWMIDFSQPSG